MKKLFSYIGKSLLFIIVLFFIYAFFTGWVNIWIKDGHAGVLYFISSSKDDNASKDDVPQVSDYTLIEKSNYYWQWKRIMPFQTQLLQVPLFLQSITIPIHYYLPNAQLYSEKIYESEDIFLSTGEVTIDYRIDSNQILSFITNNKLIASEDIIRSIERNIVNNIIQASVQSIESDNINTLKNTLYAIASRSPITNTVVNVSFQKTPDYDIYTVTKTLYHNEISNNINTTENKKQNYNQEYLFLLRNLSTLIQQTPETLELIKLLPPEKIMSLSDE